MLAVGLLTVLAWLIDTWYLDRVERRLAARKGALPGAGHRSGHPRAGASRAHDPPDEHPLRSRRPRGRAGGAGPQRRWTSHAGCSRSTTSSDWWTSTSTSFDRPGSGAIGPLPPSCWAGSAAPKRFRPCWKPLRPPGPRTRTSAKSPSVPWRGLRIPVLSSPLIRALATAEVWLAPRIADILTRHGELVVDPLIAVLE